MNIVDAVEKGWDASIDWSRRHSKVFDHAWRARLRYGEVLGGRLAAAIAYYGFFAVFALALVAYAIVGFVLANNPAAVDTVNNFLKQNIPFLDATQIAEARNTVAIVGIIGLVFTGVGWIESLRSSQRAIWRLEQQPGNLFVRRLLDLAIMIGIGLLLALSLWVQAGINDAVKPVLLQLSPKKVTVDTQDTIAAIARAVGIILGLMVNALLAASLLSGVSRIRMPLRRLVPSTVLIALGLTALSTVGRLYIDFTARRPAYQLVGGTVALLLFLYLFNQMLLFGAALAATSTRGKVVDMATGNTVARPSDSTDRTAMPRAGGAHRADDTRREPSPDGAPREPDAEQREPGADLGEPDTERRDPDGGRRPDRDRDRVDGHNVSRNLSDRK